MKKLVPKMNSNLEKNIVIEFNTFITVGIQYTHLAPFCLNFYFMTFKDCKISKFWTNIWRSNFSHQKINMVSSLELSIVIWSQYIALKLLWRIWKINVKEAPPFHTFLQIFYKNLKIFYSRILTKDLPRYSESFIPR